jgi:hypothetical protein
MSATTYAASRLMRPAVLARLPVRAPALALALAFVAAPALAHKPHEHGAAKVEVVVERGSVAVRLEGALDGFVGFERAPRNDAERQRVAQARQRLEDAAALFRFDAAAGCRAEPPQLTAAVLGWGAAPAAPGAAPAAPTGEHADLEAEFRFTCADTARIEAMDVGLFQAFSRMRRVEVNAVTPRGQFRTELRRPATRVALSR